MKKNAILWFWATILVGLMIMIPPVKAPSAVFIDNPSTTYLTINTSMYNISEYWHTSAGDLDSYEDIPSYRYWYNHSAYIIGYAGQWWYNMTTPANSYTDLASINLQVNITALNNSYAGLWYNHSAWIETTYGKWFYNQTYSGSTYNATYAASVANNSWNQSFAGTLYSGIQWGYNQTYLGGTYNATYDGLNTSYNKWWYNMTTASVYDYNHSYWIETTYNKWWYNMTYLGGTYNVSYQNYAYNQTYLGGTYNSTYDGLNTSYNKWWYNMSDGSYNATYQALNTTANIIGLINGSTFNSIWNVSGTNLYPKNLAYNVGIGTTTPGAILDIVKAGASTQASLHLQGFNEDVAYTPELRFKKSHTTTVGSLVTTIDTEVLGQIIFSGVDSGNNRDDGASIIVTQAGAAGAKVPTKLQISTYSSTAQNTGLVIDNAGNVGIGTTTPGVSLDVAGGDLRVLAKNTLVASSGTGLELRYRSDASTPAADIMSFNRTAGVYKPLNIDGSVLVLQAQSTGNVGIGTTTPGVKLDVVGAIKSSTYIQASQSFIPIINSGSNSVDLTFGTGNDAVVTFKSSAGGSNGNVGIGTTSPSFPLTIVYNANNTANNVTLWVSGNVSATGYITRTEVYDKSKGSALSYIKDSSEFLNKDGTINHQAFGYSYVSYGNTIQNGTTTQKVCNDIFSVTENKTIEQCKDETTPTYKPIIEEGIDLVKENAMLKQALYEMKTEICNKDKTYSWCS